METNVNSNHTKKTNMMFVINGLGIGGAERNLVEFLKNYDSDKYNPIVCSVGQGGAFKKDLDALGIPVFVFPKKHKFDISQVFKASKLMKANKVAVVVTILFYADIIGSLAATLARVPVCICWSAGTVGKDSKNDGIRHRYSYKLIRHMVKKVISVSNKSGEFLVKHRSVPPKKLTVIHYGVDLKNFIRLEYPQKKLQEIGLTSDHILLGEIARLNRQKGHVYLVEAAKGVVKIFPKVKFLLIGEGPLREKLQEMVDENGLTDHFLFLGLRTDVKELLNLLDIMLLPSLWEGLPNVVLEAMACGKPIIASAVDGTPEAVVDDVTGILIPPKDPRALEKAIITLLNDRDKLKKMGENARKRAEESFSIQRQIENFNNLFDLCLAEQNILQN